MGLIFYLSSRPSTHVSTDYWTNFAVAKTAHIIEYAILYFLVFRGFYLSNNKKLLSKKLFILSLLTAIIYAISDEIHQLFVPTREGRARDIIIDTIGITLMYIYIKKNTELIKKLL